MSEPTGGVSIVIPCFNEEGAVAPVLEKIESIIKSVGLPYEIIVVDDASTDNTLAEIDANRYRLIRHKTNKGYGASLKTGVRHSQFPWIVITDADGTYPIDQIPHLLQFRDQADMVVGARTGKHVKVPLIRRPAKWFLNKLANYISGHKIPDLNSGLRVIDHNLFNRFERFFPDGFSLTTTITLASLTSGFRVEFVPIDYHHRLGKSKIRPIRDTINFFILVIRTVLYFDPLKVFVPISLLLLLASALIGGTTLILSNIFGIGQFMDVSTLVLLVTALQLLAIGVLADLITKRLP